MLMTKFRMHTLKRPNIHIRRNIISLISIIIFSYFRKNNHKLCFLNKLKYFRLHDEEVLTARNDIIFIESNGRNALN